MIWLFLTAVVIAATFLTTLLLRIRVQDGRIDRDSAARLHELMQSEASQVALAARDVEMERAKADARKMDYAVQQLQFAQRVLDLHQQGLWGGDTQALIDACARQLDGVPPPHHAPELAIKTRTYPEFNFNVESMRR